MITADDLILVNHAGVVIGGGKNRLLNFGTQSNSFAVFQKANRQEAAFAIHSEIHAARPDVLCAAHSHSVYGRAFCATGMYSYGQ